MPAFRTPSFLIQMLFCSLLWALGFPLIKIIGADVTPWPLAAMRGILGSLALALWFAARGTPLRPHGREWRDWIVLGLFQGCLPNVLIAVAVAHIPSGLASMIEAGCPLLVAVVAHRLYADERLDARRLAGLLVGFSGMTILLWPSAVSDAGETSLVGVLAALGGAVSYAFGNLYVRAIPAMDPSRLAFGQQLFSGLPALGLALAEGGPGAFAGVPEHVGALLVFGLLATALPMLTYMHLFRLAGPTLASTIGYLIPVWTVIIGIVFLDETIAASAILGGGVVLAGVAVVSRRKASLKPARPGRGLPKEAGTP
jgi:drug/metabolite transporter (DMT)-like permease